jgi:hypothetical protein
MGKQFDKTVEHIIPGCPALAMEEYMDLTIGPAHNIF